MTKAKPKPVARVAIETATAPASNVLSTKAVLASLNISTWTARRADATVTDEVHKQHNASQDAGRYWKRLIDKSAMAAIGSAKSKARDFHYLHTLPWRDDGSRVLPTALFIDYARAMKEFRLEFEAAAETFCREYPGFIDRARRDLNGMFNAADYPDADSIRAKFGFDVTIMKCPDANDDFRTSIPEEFVDDLRSDLEAKMRDVVNGTLRDAGARVIELVGRMADRLKSYQPATDDAPAKNPFRDSTVENVQELATLLPAFNLTGDPKLAKIIDGVRALATFDADQLRQNDSARMTAAAKADAILADVSSFIA
jgi:hypothetical protein